MRHVREALRLMLSLGMSNRETAQFMSISHNTAGRYRKLVQQSELDWQSIEALSDKDLEKIIFPHKQKNTSTFDNIDWAYIEKELKRKGVTKRLLWLEYKSANLQGMSYSNFTRTYRAYLKKNNITMRQNHKAGEKIFVDYSGQTMPIIDKHSGQILSAQIFVGVLGASGYCFAEATMSQKLSDWINSHIRMFKYYGAIPKVVVPDNLRSAVSRSSAFDPIINPSYQKLAEHYDIAIIPTRVYKPKDKALVERMVLMVQRHILAKLRNHTFFSIEELNQAILPLLNELNNQDMQKHKTSRRALFEHIDLPVMRPLPATSFENAEWLTNIRVGLDYHITIKGAAYSVPYQLAGEKVDVKIGLNSIECYFNRKCIAEHPKVEAPEKTSTLKEHMPKAHQKYAEKSTDRLLQWASNIGESTLKVVETILQSKKHPEQGYKACLGLKKLAKTHSKERLEKACHRALNINSPCFTSIESILVHRMESQPIIHADSNTSSRKSFSHENVRGQQYYMGE